MDELEAYADMLDKRVQDGTLDKGEASTLLAQARADYLESEQEETKLFSEEEEEIELLRQEFEHDLNN